MKHWITLIMMVILASTLLAEPMPEFKLPNEAGNKISLTELLGKGPVIVDFWADYCQPCKQAMPALNSLVQSYDSLTVVLISIDAPKAQNKAKNFLKGKDYKFVTSLTRIKMLANKLNVTEPPHTFILDKTGEIVLEHKGFTAGVEKEYEMKIRSLLGLGAEKGHGCQSETPCADCLRAMNTEPGTDPVPKEGGASPCNGCR